MAMENIGVTDVTWKRGKKYYINCNLNLSSNTEVVLNISVLGNMVTWNYNSTTNYKFWKSPHLENCYIIVRDWRYVTDVTICP